MNTKVSILTPTLNAMEYIQECVQSVLTQDYQDIEHVIADAGSTDGTFEYLLELSNQFPHRIKVVHSGDDKGVGDGLNSALRKSTGSIIGWLDADDLLEINAISKVVQVFNSSKNTHFIYGNCTIINSASNPIGEFIVRDFDKWEWVNRWHYIIFCGVYFRRGVVEKVGFVNSLGNDLEFYLRVAKKFALQRVDFNIAMWRYHTSSISHEDSPRSHRIRFKRAKEDFFLVLKHKGSLFSPKSINFILILGKICMNNRIIRSIAKFFKVEKVKSVLVYNITNSNTFIRSNQSYSITLLKIVVRRFVLTNRFFHFLQRILNKCRLLLQRILNKSRLLSVPFFWVALLLSFFRLEFNSQRKLRQRKKYYKV